MKSILIFMCVFTYCTGYCNSSYGRILEYNFTDSSILLSDSIDIETENINKTKIIAIALALTLGPFGVHRLYLGTKPIVPIAYTLTLGGGFFILPAIDIIYILVTKDLKQIKNNNFVFIWNKNRILKKNL